MSIVTICDAPLSIEELVAVADGAPVELAAAARARIEASRAVVDIALASGDAVYGVTTHVGHGKDVRLSEDELRDLEQAVQGDEVEYALTLPGEGGETEVFFSDLSHEYVTINAEYTT